MILIEGLDLAGKSTLVRALARRLQSEGNPVRLSRNSLCPDNPLAALADRWRRDPSRDLVGTGALFLAAHRWDVGHFRRPLGRRVHLQDSCWLRTLAFERTFGSPGLAWLLEASSSDAPRFDRAIFVTASLEERARRLQQRAAERPGENDAGDHWVVDAPERFLLLEETLRSLAARHCGARVLDTTHLTPTAALEAAWERLELGARRRAEPA